LPSKLTALQSYKESLTFAASGTLLGQEVSRRGPEFRSGTDFAYSRLQELYQPFGRQVQRFKTIICLIIRSRKIKIRALGYLPSGPGKALILYR
jgi:hypothetical protein